MSEIIPRERASDKRSESLYDVVEETYKEMGQQYQPSKEDVRSYMKMVDTDGDGHITLDEF